MHIYSNILSIKISLRKSYVLKSKSACGFSLIAVGSKYRNSNISLSDPPDHLKSIW